MKKSKEALLCGDTIYLKSLNGGYMVWQFQFNNSGTTGYICSASNLDNYVQKESSSREISSWLRSDSTLSKYASIFEKKEINGYTLSNYTERQIVELGIEDEIDRKKIYAMAKTIAANERHQSIGQSREKTESCSFKITSKGRKCDQITYGEEIELEHCTSRKLISMVPIGARIEKDCFKVMLVDQNEKEKMSALTTFRIIPRYKTRKEGEVVFIGDNVLFLMNVSGHMPQYLHVSDTMQKNVAEVNISISPSVWRPILFRNAVQRKKKRKSCS